MTSPSNTSFEESDSSDSESSHSVETARLEPISLHSRISLSMSSEQPVTVFGNSLQRYGQQLTNALSKFKVTDDLEDGNYASWYRSIFDNLETLELHNYIVKEDYVDLELTEDKRVKTKKVVVSYILNRLDKANHCQAINHLTDPEDPNSIIHNPYSLWSYLKDRHYLINAQRLSSISKSLSSITISKSDSLSSYLDKFESLFIEFTRYGGKMDDTQSALRLIDSIDRLSESTVEFIHSTITPLSRKGVVKYLRDFDTRHNFNTVSSANASEANSTQNHFKGRRIECTESVCKGPHPSERCWLKPENFKERDDFLARRRACRVNPTGRSHPSSLPPIRGMKKVTPSANLITETFDRISLHTSYEDVTGSETPAAHSSKSQSTNSTMWALHDTGATHHMFNSADVFVAGSLKPAEDPN